MITNPTGPMITDFSAKRDRRILAGDDAPTYAALKRQAHRRERRNNRVVLLEDGDALPAQPTRRLTGWDVA